MGFEAVFLNDTHFGVHTGYGREVAYLMLGRGGVFDGGGGGQI